MAKKTQPRTADEIRTEYARLCAKAGDLEFKSGAMQRELAEEVYPRMYALAAELEQVKDSSAGPPGVPVKKAG